jgi:hypothetical protein
MKKILMLVIVLGVSNMVAQNYCSAQSIDARSIIGKTTQIENLLVAEYDMPKEMSWDQAMNACVLLYNDFRLPNQIELNKIFENRQKLKNLGNFTYWSSTQQSATEAWDQRFGDGFQGVNIKKATLLDQKPAHVRCVKSAN